MKYIIRNIILFIKNQTSLFMITMLAISSSVLLLHFSYSMYQSFMKSKEAEEFEKTYISVKINDKFEKYDVNEDNGFYKIRKIKNQDYVTVSELKKLVGNLSDSFQDELINIGVKGCVGNVPLYFNLSAENNEIIKSDFYETNLKANHLLTEGRYFTEEEYSKGLRVAIIYDSSTNKNTDFSNSILSSDPKKICLEGKEYEIIGKQQIYSDQPIIPFTCLSDSTPLYGFLEFEFREPANSVEYEELKENINLYFGDHATLESVQLPDKNKIYLYNTMIVIAILIAVISALNFGILYQYLLKMRQEEIRAMLICGLRKRKAIFMFVTECIFLTLPAYVVSVFVYDCFLLKILSDSYEYVENHYSVWLYFILFIIYYVSSILVLTFSIFYSFKKERRIRIGGGCE